MFLTKNNARQAVFGMQHIGKQMMYNSYAIKVAHQQVNITSSTTFRAVCELIGQSPRDFHVIAPLIDLSNRHSLHQFKAHCKFLGHLLL